MLRRGFQSLQMRQHADPGRDHRRKLASGHHRDHARHRLRRRHVECGDPGMGVGRTNEDDMGHARQHDVADILSAALHQAVEIGARHGLADIGIRPIENRKHLSLF